MFLRVSATATASDVDALLAELSEMWGSLAGGHIRDLPGQDIQSSSLEILIGYGPNVFRVPDVKRPLPDELGPRHQFRRPAPAGNEILAGTSIKYAAGIARNPATEEILVQGTGGTPLSVNRLVVETAKLIADMTPGDAEPVLAIGTAYTGFNREDARSWIDFHDGTSNLRSGEDRRQAISIKPVPAVPGPDGWTEGGSYLTFIRLSVNIEAWRTLSVSEQEIAVGRAKLTGCPLTGVLADGTPVAAAGCPVVGTGNVGEGDNGRFFEPPVPTSTIIEATHVQRANHHIGLPLGNKDSFRIYRQGYEFFEPPQLDRQMAIGLNFVSFQDSLDRVFHILQQPNWLGSVNFGGSDVSQPPALARLLTAHAAGVFLIPPVKAGESYPGQSIFR